MLNYGYALLESECLRAINSVGLDAHVGFLHEMNPSKNSLAYDLQEPFRFIVDLAVMNLIEKGAMDSKDFIRTESFSLRLRPSGRKVTEEFNSLMNGKVEYRKKMGFSKGTLHYMKQNARSEMPFTLNALVRERLEMWSGVRIIKIGRRHSACDLCCIIYPCLVRKNIPTINRANIESPSVKLGVVFEDSVAPILSNMAS